MANPWRRRLALMAWAAFVIAIAGCRQASVEFPSKLAPSPTEPGTFQKMPNLKP